MTNANIVLDKSNILAFIVKPSTGFSEHYVSSQPLNLYIPYTEYISLIKHLVESNLDILRTPLSVYKGALNAGEASKQMFKLYHYDIALAGLEELYKSYKRVSPCTRIFGLVDCDSSIRVETVSFDLSAEFIQANFSQVERKELYSFIGNIKDISLNQLTESKLESNINMYFMCMAYIGIFKLQKDFIITVKEE